MRQFASDDDAHHPEETSPLLNGKPSDPNTSSSDREDKSGLKQHSRTQLIILCYARLMEPLAFFSIFPYVAEMVQRNGNLEHADIGFYSGLVEALFSATQAVTLFFWGWWADRFGRKPVLVASLLGMTIGTGVFSMSHTLWQMMLFRSLTGLFSGANLVIRTMIGESCTQETQAVFFAWYAAAGNLGIFIGPIVGGVLSNPARQYPRAFGHINFLRENPYALSGFAAAAMNVTAVLASAFVLKETNPRTTDKYVFKSNDSPNKKPHSVSFKTLIRAPKVLAVLGVYSYAMTLAVFFTAIHPVVLYTQVSYGGLGLSTSEITLFITLIGATESLWLMIVFPILQRRTGTKFVLKVCCWLWPVFLAGYVATNEFLRHDCKIMAILVSAANILLGPGAFMSLTVVQMAINEVSPSRDALAKLNSVAEFSFSIIRSVIPGIATTIFALGARGNNGYLGWMVLLVAALGLPFSLRLFPESGSLLEGQLADCETYGCPT